MKKHRRFCRGPSLVCMNNVFDRIGEYSEVIDATAEMSTLSTMSNTTAEEESKMQKVILNILTFFKSVSKLHSSY